VGGNREQRGLSEAASDHCARAIEFEENATTVESWLNEAPTDEVRETLKVISQNWRQLADLHRRLATRCPSRGARDR